MCAHCRLLRTHPPLEPDCCMPGHVYCDLCGLWMKIGNLEEVREREKARSRKW
jgi:hypothetical protein